MPDVIPLARWLPERTAGEVAGIAALLEERLAAARAKWPSVQLDDAAFFDRLWPHGAPAARRAPATHAGISALHIEDLFLACACAKGDRAALAALETGVLANVPRWVARFHGISADEVQQELRHKLLLGSSGHLLEYAGRGPLARWIRVAAARCAIDLQRKLKPEGEQADAVEQLLSSPDPELDFIKLHDREALRGILRDAVRSLPAQSRVLLRLHYLESVSLERLAVLEQVHRATVARRLAEARAAALEEVHRLLRERLKLTQSEGQSLLRLLESRLDLSLRGAFTSHDP